MTSLMGTVFGFTTLPASHPGRGGRTSSTRGRCDRIMIHVGARNVVCSNAFVKKRILGSKPEPTTGVSASATAAVVPKDNPDQYIVYHGMHHVGLLCENLEKSLEFYIGVLGLELNPDRPDEKLPYRGAWLWIGPEMIHLMELPNPDPLHGRPEHGGRDRHFCVGVKDIAPLQEKLDKAGIEYTKSMSGRQAMFFRDPDMNCLECVEMDSSWR